jgi:cytochrome c biogenesis factor
MRVIAAIIIILGLAVLVFGIVFLPKASSAEQEVADSLTSPVTLDTLDVTYDNIDQQVRSMQGNEAQYLTLFAQRTSLGLARSNVGSASLVRMLGIINIIAGLGLVLTGTVLLRKTS